MSDDQLADAVDRLQRTVADLQHARGEVGLRIRATYAQALDEALDERERRRS
ncbi:MAG: hypothetical protein AB7O31_13450 [Burkholderiales bacterium]